MANGNTMLDRNNNGEPKLRNNHKTNGKPTLNPKITPYDTGKVKIGSNYHPKINCHDPDQDWVQKAMLGIETSWTTDIVVFCALYSVILYAIMGLISRSWYD